jgi:pyruvate carboxylase
VYIEQWKTLFIKLVNLVPVDKDGHRIVFFELIGMTRVVTITDLAAALATIPRGTIPNNTTSATWQAGLDRDLAVTG